MLDFHPLETYPCPPQEVVIVHLIDDKYAWGIFQPKEIEDFWYIQLPFKKIRGASSSAIVEWAELPTNKANSLRLKHHK